MAGLERQAITYFRLRRRACHAPAMPRKLVRARRPPPLDCDCPCPLFPLLLLLGELVLLGEELWSELGGLVLLGDCELGDWVLLGEELWSLLDGLVLLGEVVVLGEVVLLGEELWSELLGEVVLLGELLCGLELLGEL